MINKILTNKQLRIIIIKLTHHKQAKTSLINTILSGIRTSLNKINTQIKIYSKRNYP